MIQAENLSKAFNNDFMAVDDVNLDVQPGQVLALLGQNGAGKTTTIRMLTGLLRPTKGWARVAGYDVIEDATAVRSSVGVLTEQHGLYLRMTAGEYLDFFGKVYELDAPTRQKRSAHLLEYFGLEDATHRRIGEYSKGMRQKLALAHTLIHERAIIICTHNLVEAETLADEIAIIYQGKILLKGKLDALKDHVLGNPEYEVHFSSTWNIQDFKTPSDVELIEKTPLKLRFRSQNPDKFNALVLQKLSEVKAPVLTLEEVPRSLEQVYLKVMADAAAKVVI